MHIEESAEVGVGVVVVSVGNTNTAVGMWGGKAITEYRSIVNTDADAVAKSIASLAGEGGYDRPIVVASVRHSKRDEILSALRGQVSGDVLVFGRDIEIPITHALTDEAIRGTGQDRLLGALAAHRITGQACVVVDAGTAVTVDFVDGEGTFQGGAIAPGVQMSLDALARTSDALPKVSFRAPEGGMGAGLGGEPAGIAFGANTEQAMLHGVAYGVRGLVHVLVERYAAAYEAYPRVIATGGDAQALFENDEIVERIVPELALIGIGFACQAALSDDED